MAIENGDSITIGPGIGDVCLGVESQDVVEREGCVLGKRTRQVVGVHIAAEEATREAGGEA